MKRGTCDFNQISSLGENYVAKIVVVMFEKLYAEFVDVIAPGAPVWSSPPYGS